MQTIANSSGVSYELEMLKTKLEKGVMDDDFLSLRNQMDKIGNGNKEVNLTTLWHWLNDKTDFDLDFFDNTPPIFEAEVSDRIIICASKAENRDIYKLFESWRVEKAASKWKKIKTLTFSRFRDQKTISNPFPEISGFELSSEFVHSSEVGYFWDSFFAAKYFLDEDITIPKMIISTGFMRSYMGNAGTTYPVSDRLREIAESWDIPIHFIESWCI